MNLMPGLELYDPLKDGNEGLLGRRVLIVDDDPDFHALLGHYLEEDDYTVLGVHSGEEALARAEELVPDLILLDVMMQGMDGFEVARHLKQHPVTRVIPIIMLTALNARNARLLGLEAGVEEFLTKPVERMELRVRVRNLLRLKTYQNFLRHHNELLEQQVRSNTQRVRELFIETVSTLTRASEYRDEATGTHVNRISYYCDELAAQLGMDDDFRDKIFHASPMHDIGKLAIPDQVLLKPGRLIEDEWQVMRTHTTLGEKILEGTRSPYMQMGMQIARSHHECWEGGGYPDGLKGESIPLAARIMAICDVYDALRSPRPYKPGMSHQQALEILKSGDDRIQAGKFDPGISAAFDAGSDRFAEIYAQMAPDTPT